MDINQNSKTKKIEKFAKRGGTMKWSELVSTDPCDPETYSGKMQKEAYPDEYNEEKNS